MSVRIICDSASDITQEQAKDWGITVLPMKILWEGEEYLDGVTLKSKEFFEKLIETDELPTTSQISPFDYEQAFQEAVEEGDTVIVPTYDAARKREVVRKAVVAHKNHLVPAEALTHPLKKIIGVLRKIR